LKKTPVAEHATTKFLTIMQEAAHLQHHISREPTKANAERHHQPNQHQGETNIHGE